MSLFVKSPIQGDRCCFLPSFFYIRRFGMESGSLKAAIRMLGPIAWLALAAGLQMLGALLYFKAPADAILVGTYFCIAFSIYLFNRFTDHEDSYNYPDQKMYFQKRAALKAIPVMLISLSILILALTNRLVLWHAILIVGGILYSASIIPFFRKRSFTFIRLKDIVFIKNAVVGMLWGVTPFAIAVQFKTSEFSVSNDLFIIIFAFCITTFINTTSCDVRDIKGDRHAGVKTLATIFGAKSIGFFLICLGLGASLFVGINFFKGMYTQTPTILFFTTIIWTGIVALPIYFNKIKLSKAISEPLIDTQQVFCGIALIVFSIA
jgi:4-hydroxybenzoate polyprenyltransferase